MKCLKKNATKHIELPKLRCDHLMQEESRVTKKKKCPRELYILYFNQQVIVVFGREAKS